MKGTWNKRESTNNEQRNQKNVVVNIISECKVIIKNSLWSAKNKNRNKFYIILTRKAFEVEMGSIVGS